MEIDEDDAPYLNFQDDRECQAYAMIKNRSFGHTRAFDLDLLEKIGMNIDLSSCLACGSMGWFCAH